MVGVQVRNLDYLNRDLSKVLLITANPNAHHLQPDNAIKVGPCHIHSLCIKCAALWWTFYVSL